MLNFIIIYLLNTLIIKDLSSLAPRKCLSQVQKNINSQEVLCEDFSEVLRDELLEEENEVYQEIDFYSQILERNLLFDDLEREIVFCDIKKIKWLEVDPHYLYIDSQFEVDIVNLYLEGREGRCKKIGRGFLDKNKKVVEEDFIIIYSLVYQVLNIAKERFDSVKSFHSISEEFFLKLIDKKSTRSLERDVLFLTVLILSIGVCQERYPFIKKINLQKGFVIKYKVREEGNEEESKEEGDTDGFFMKFYKKCIFSFLKSHPDFLNSLGISLKNQEIGLEEIERELKKNYSAVKLYMPPNLHSYSERVYLNKKNIKCNPLKIKEIPKRVSYKNYILIVALLSMMLMIFFLLSAGKSLMLKVCALILGGGLCFIFLGLSFFYTKYSKKKKTLSRTQSNPPLAFVCMAQLFVVILLTVYMKGQGVVFEMLAYLMLLWTACVGVQVIIGAIKFYYQDYKKEYHRFYKKSEYRKSKKQKINIFYYFFKRKSLNYVKSIYKITTQKLSVLTIICFLFLSCLYGFTFLPVPIQLLSMALIEGIRGGLVSIAVGFLVLMMGMVGGIKLFQYALGNKKRESSFFKVGTLENKINEDMMDILSRYSNREKSFGVQYVWSMTKVGGVLFIISALIYMFCVSIVGMADILNKIFVSMYLSFGLLAIVKGVTVYCVRVLYKVKRYRKISRSEIFVMGGIVILMVLSVVLTAVCVSLFPTAILSPFLKTFPDKKMISILVYGWINIGSVLGVGGVIWSLYLCVKLGWERHKENKKLNKIKKEVCENVCLNEKEVINKVREERIEKNQKIKSEESQINSKVKEELKKEECIQEAFEEERHWSDCYEGSRQFKENLFELKRQNANRRSLLRGSLKKISKYQVYSIKEGSLRQGDSEKNSDFFLQPVRPIKRKGVEWGEEVVRAHLKGMEVFEKEKSQQRIRINQERSMLEQRKIVCLA